tara:strand:- start:1640 stop:1852 length:213 start_codon:yes stop_codon:yes gene_type:complete
MEDICVTVYTFSGNIDNINELKILQFFEKNNLFILKNNKIPIVDKITCTYKTTLVSKMPSGVNIFIKYKK